MSINANQNKTHAYMTALTLIIGNKNYSSWSLRPWIFLQHFEIEYEEIRIALFTDSTNDQLAQYGTDFKVPILLDGKLTVWDSLSILEYLSENYLHHKGLPADNASRAAARSISAEMHSSFQHVRNALPMNCRKTFNNITLSTDTEQDIERIKTLWRQYRIQHKDRGEWLFGDFSIADAMFAPIALRFTGYNIPLTGIEQDYVNSFINHPKIIEWVAAGKRETEIIAEDEIDQT